VALIAHALAVIRNRLFKGTVNPERVALLAVFHDAGEVITGDLATPIKTFNPEIKAAYRRLEDVARERLLGMLPEELKPDYRPLLFAQDADREHWQLVKAADKIAAHLKCVEERQCGNHAFVKAEKALKRTIDGLELDEVRYFMDTYAGSFLLTLDELN